MAQRMICEGARGVKKCWSAHQEQGGAWLGAKHGALACGNVVECPHAWMEVTNPNAVESSNLKVHVGWNLPLQVSGK